MVFTAEVAEERRGNKHLWTLGFGLWAALLIERRVHRVTQGKAKSGETAVPAKAAKAD
jgi:hypothetical protein